MNEKKVPAPDPLRSKFEAINRTATLKRINDELRNTEEGMELVRNEVSKLYSILESKISKLRGRDLQLPFTNGSARTGEFIVHGPAASYQRFRLRFIAEGLGYSDATEVTLKWQIAFEEKSAGVKEIGSPYYRPFFKEDRQVVWRSGQAIHNSEQVATEALTKFGDSIIDQFKDFEIP